jgi:hypothetical protein
LEIPIHTYNVKKAWWLVRTVVEFWPEYEAEGIIYIA